MRSGRPQAEAAETPRQAQTKRSKLTATQLERKRELDREAQRTIRAKTKSHIAHLESLVQTLQEAEGSSGRVRDLVAQVKSNQEEINRLRDALGGIGKIINAVTEVGGASQNQASAENTTEQETRNQRNVSTCSVQTKTEDPDVGQTGLHASIFRQFSDNGSLFDDRHPTEGPPSKRMRWSSHDEGQPLTSRREHLDFEDIDPLDPLDSLAPVVGTDSPPATLPSHCNQVARRNSVSEIASQILANKSLEGRLWYLAGTILSNILSTPDIELTPMEFADDIVVRAVINGWPEAASRYSLDAGWLWLRHLDEALYSALGIPERLAIMRVMRLQYLAQVQPSMKYRLPIPGFLKARPAQLYVDHDPLVEHFVWPGLREHILFSPRKYATNRFMETFQSETRFMWPFDQHDTYMRNAVTGLYSYSPLFVERQNDLRCWSMKAEFFRQFPELRQDVPAFDHSPLNSCLLLSPAQQFSRITDVTNDSSSTSSSEDDKHDSSYNAMFPLITGQANPPDPTIVPDWAPEFFSDIVDPQ